MNLKQYKEYINDNPKGYWFKRKTYGWGWTPARWQGWVSVLIYIILVLILSSTLDESISNREMTFTFFLPLAFLTTSLIAVSYFKGEPPAWMWGRDKKEE
jgi:hypothetical protein